MRKAWAANTVMDRVVARPHIPFAAHPADRLKSGVILRAFTQHANPPWPLTRKCVSGILKSSCVGWKSSHRHLSYTLGCTILTPELYPENDHAQLT